MRSFSVNEAVDLNTAASQTEIDMSTKDVPFVAGNSAVAVFSLTAAAGTALRLEGRDDDSGAWSTLAEVLAAAGAGTFFRNVDAITQEIRVTVVGTAGSGEEASVFLLQN